MILTEQMMRFVTPLLHPSSVLRGNHHLEPAQIAYLKRVVRDPNPTLVNPRDLPPGCNPDPTLDQLNHFSTMVRGFSRCVSFDIENAGPHLVCVGMVRVHQDLTPADGVCFRFRRCGGEPWWPKFEDHVRVVHILDGILGDPTVTKVGHFCVMHDIPFLTNLGFEFAGKIIDTSVLLHSTHSELPKGLAFNATLFCGAPRWKDIKDDPKEAGGEAEEE